MPTNIVANCWVTLTSLKKETSSDLGKVIHPTKTWHNKIGEAQRILGMTKWLGEIGLALRVGEINHSNVAPIHASSSVDANAILQVTEVD